MALPPPTNLATAFRPARDAVLLWVALTTCAVVAVWMGGNYGQRKLSEAIRNDATSAARAAMLGLDPMLHERIARSETMWSDHHKRALTTLVNFHRQFPDVSRVRTFMASGGQIFVILDTETVAGDVGMKRPVDPIPLRTELDKGDPAYPIIERVLQTREPAAAESSHYDGYRQWRPGVAPLGSNAAIEADLTSITQEQSLANLRMWIATGIGISVIACGVVALLFFNIRSAHLASESTGSEAERGREWLEQRNQRLVEALGHVVLHRDLTAGCLLWDGDTKKLLGVSRDRMPMDFKGWLARIHPDDANRVAQATRHAAPENRTYELEYRVRHEGDVWLWFRERGVVTFGGEVEMPAPITVDCVLEDISALKNEEEELAALALIASRTNNAVSLTDNHGRVIWTNETFEKLTGVGPTDARQKALPEIFPDSPGTAAIRALIGNAILGQGGRTEVELHHASGASYWANLEIQPLKNELGEITRLVAIQSDITAAKQFEARLVHAKDAAETADRAKSEFLAVMSHEIRTPLNAVLGFSRLLLDTPLTSQQHDYIDTIRSSGDSLLHLLNDILDFSKMDASGVQLEQSAFDLRGCVEDALNVLIGPATNRGLDLYGDIDLDVPAVVVGDRGRMRQILLNLAGNAVKFTDRGEVVVSVHCLAEAAAASSQARLRFEVRDTGPGIAPDQHGQLFRPFTQADSSATRKHGGTGLGLAISKRLVTLMGGEIGLNSTPGEGSTFWFEIPLTVAEHQPVPSSELRALEGLRALIVEKNLGLRRVLTTQLTAWGMQVEAFGRGRDAIFAAEHRRFDIALLDCAPPDMDGLQLVDRLRNSPRRNVGGILLAGPPGRLPVAAAGPFDAIHRLVKPIHASTLAETILRAAPRIPRIAIPKALPAASPQPAPVDAESDPQILSNGRRVLVADDNAINRKLVKKMLDGMGCDSALVANGRECVEAMKSGRFDAILMDIQMPEMDGLAAARAIRELGHAIPIIALTADAMPDDRARCLAAGMNDYLQKPVRPDALGAALDRASSAAA